MNDAHIAIFRTENFTLELFCDNIGWFCMEKKNAINFRYIFIPFSLPFEKRYAVKISLNILKNILSLSRHFTFIFVLLLSP